MQPILNPNLEGFYEANKRYYVLYGGRSSGKSFHTAGFCVFLASQYKVKFLCVRQFQNRIGQSVKSTIEKCIDLAGMRKDFHITENSITHKKTGSDFTFLGINRNLEDIKGVFGVDILWIEEAEGLTQDQWKVIIPTIREEGSKVFIVFNPRKVDDFVWKNFVINERPRSIVKKINYDKNPYLSQTMKDEIEDYKDSYDFDHIYLGEPITDNNNSIIKRSHLLAAVDADKKLGIERLGSNTIGFDVADDGADGCALIQTLGNCAVWADQWKGKTDELLKSCTRAWQEAHNRNADIVYDTHGLGAFVGSKMNDINKESKSGTKVDYKKYFSNGAVLQPERFYLDTKVKNKHYFSNRKAQSWHSIAHRLRNTYNAVTHGEVFDTDEMIFIDGSIPYLNALIDELCTPNTDFDNAGRVKVEGKKDLKKRGVASPNLADAFIMAFDKTGVGSNKVNVSHFWSRKML